MTTDTAEISQFDGRAWDRTVPGLATFDAVHRSALLRFPGSAGLIGDKLASGLRISSARIELDYAGYEIDAPGYVVRHALGKPKWAADTPTWHVVRWGGAYALDG